MIDEHEKALISPKAPVTNPTPGALARELYEKLVADGWITEIYKGATPACHKEILHALTRATEPLMADCVALRQAFNNYPHVPSHQTCLDVLNSPHPGQHLFDELLRLRITANERDALLVEMEHFLELAKGFDFNYRELMKAAPWSESNDMDIADEFNCGLQGLIDERDQLRTRLAEALKDKERLDWLGEGLLLGSDERITAPNIEKLLDGELEKGVRQAIDSAKEQPCPS